MATFVVQQTVDLFMLRVFIFLYAGLNKLNKPILKYTITCNELDFAKMC